MTDRRERKERIATMQRMSSRLTGTLCFRNRTRLIKNLTLN